MTDSLDTFLSQWAKSEQAADVDALDRYLAPDFYGVGPLGFILPRQAWLARHQARDLRYASFDLDEIQTHRYGDVAVVTFRNNTTGTYQGHPIPEAVRATLIAVGDSGSWRIGALHMSFVAGTAGAPPIPGPPASNQS